MARRRNIWEQIWESTEGPTVTVTIPRELADALLQSLAAGLEQDLPDDEAGDDEDLGSMDDLDFGGEDDSGGHANGMGDDDDGMGMDDMFDMPAGDDDDEEGDDEPAPPKRGPGRPPGAKNKKKDDGGKKGPPEKDDESDDDEEDKQDEAAGDYRPQTALGESAFSRLSKKLDRNPKVSDPDALAASIGRKKYGAQGMAAKSAAGRRKH
jgi:hypothetical protein